MPQFKKNNILSKLGLLLFWPIYLVVFVYLERFHDVEEYTPVYCPLDDLIPFCEGFLIPYLFWYVFLAGSVFFTLFTDSGAFQRMMRFVILTHTAALIIFFLFPNCQELRPTSFERDNMLTRFMADFYRFDTNTNVCPSLHVIGSVSAMLGFRDCKPFSNRSSKLILGVITVLISISTVFLKQHSILDMVAAAPICLIAYALVYQKRESPQTSAKRKKTASI